MDCGCGRSPNGKCLGWHDLSEEEYLEKLKEYEASQKVDWNPLGRDYLLFSDWLVLVVPIFII